MTQFINLYGGAGNGKSTLAADIFSKLKYRGVSCELVTEFAKDIVWDRSYHHLDDQQWVFANQRRRLTRMIGQVDVVVTDSPLALTLAYGKNNSPEFNTYVKSEADKLDNFNVFVYRNELLHTGGRKDNKERSESIDKSLHELLVFHYYVVTDPESAANDVIGAFHDRDRFRETGTYSNFIQWR